MNMNVKHRLRSTGERVVPLVEGNFKNPGLPPGYVWTRLPPQAPGHRPRFQAIRSENLREEA